MSDFSKSLFWHSGLQVVLENISKLIQWVQCSRENWTHKRFASTKPVSVIHIHGASAYCLQKKIFLNRITKVECWMCIIMVTYFLGKYRNIAPQIPNSLILFCMMSVIIGIFFI